MLPTVNLCFGLLYVFYSSVSLFMHAVVCWALISAPHFKKHVALRMMLFLSLSDALQLVIHLFSGILILSNSTINLTINQTIGFLALTLWNAMIFQQTTLAVNRFYVLIRKQFSVPNPRSINLMIAMSWTGALLFQIGYYSQGERFYFSTEVANWLEDVNDTILFTIMRYFKIVCLIVGLIAGVGMFFCVIYQNCATHPKNRAHTSTEMRLFIQTCCSPLLGLINMFIWTYFSKQVANGGVVVQGLTNFEWILINEKFETQWLNYWVLNDRQTQN
ncbi:hypothetical protein M3Y96_00197500 [Aphelenchoides besseyi]|nr:hypothetical protein M3Y96_00197500 [Aphelenchoides besseyi]